MKLISLFVFCALSLFAYEKPDVVSQEDWEKALPYLLPENHKLKPKLDKLFQDVKRPTLMTASLTLQGFELICVNDRSGLVIAKHPKLKGFVLKIIPDAHPTGGELYGFLRRVEGAELIRNAIEGLGWQEDFNVVKKWIYPLPESTQVLPPGFIRKYFILVAEDAELASPKKNGYLWQSNFITEEKLFKLHHLVAALGLNDSLYIDNIPIATDGRITFIDTENTCNWCINWERFTKYLSPEMQEFWLGLINP